MKRSVVLLLFGLISLGSARKFSKVRVENPAEGKRNPNGLVGAADTNFVEKPSIIDGYSKWEQRFNGVPVYGSQVTTKMDDQGFVTGIYGTVADSIDVQTEPTISSSDALGSLKRNWNHTQLPQSLFYDESAVLNIFKQENEPDALVWYTVYKVNEVPESIRNNETGPSPAYIVGLVNAHSGQIESTWNNIQNAVIPGVIGNNKIGKSIVNIDVQQSGSTCQHLDNTRRILVKDLNNWQLIRWFATTTFTCADADNDNWDDYQSTEGYSPRNEAFYHAVQFYDMWTTLTNTSPHRTATSQLTFNVHVSRGYDNAYFDGNEFFFGDGQNVFYPLTTLDVVCHEVGHAMTSWHGGNMDYSGESGGMNEAYSDILGETCDMHYKSKNNFFIGDDCTRTSYYGGKLRDMCNPGNTGSLDSYLQYNQNVDVHYSSGIYNKAWCTLANTSGWDFINAFKVFTRANLLYWSQTETMHCGACDVQQAATDLGFSSAEVAAAFAAVDVFCNSC